MRKFYIALSIGLSLIAGAAIAGTTTTNYPSLGAQVFFLVTNGSSQALGAHTIWDYAAGANGMAVNASHQASVSLDGGTGATVAATQSGTWSFSLSAQTSGGASPGNLIVANNTTAVVVKASAGTIYGAQLGGIGSVPAYLKIYNAASATCGSGTPSKRLIIPAASTAANGAGSNVSFGDVGVAFGTGITICVTLGIADNDTTAPPASTYLVNLDFK